MLVELSGFFFCGFFFLFLFFLLSLINVAQVSSYCAVNPKESLPAVPAAQLWLISAESELELSFLCLSSPLVLCAAPPHSLCANQVKDNEVLCLVGKLSSISTSFLGLFIHKPVFLIYLFLLAWKHILCGIWAFGLHLDCPNPLVSNVLAIKQCFSAACADKHCPPRNLVLWHWEALAVPCSSHLCWKCNISSKKGCYSLLLRHWWPIFIFPRAVQRQKKVRPSEGVRLINWSLLPVPECRLELEHAGSLSWIHRKQLEAFLISSSNTHLPLNVWMVFEILACSNCIKAALAFDAVLWAHLHPLSFSVPARERHFKKDAFLRVTFMFQFKKPQEVPDFHSSDCILPDELILWHINNRESSDLQHSCHHCGASAAHCHVGTCFPILRKWEQVTSPSHPWGTAVQRWGNASVSLK